MPGKYALNWDLDSLFPNPQTADFAKAVEDYKQALTGLARRADELPKITASGSVATWAEFGGEFERIECLATDLLSFINCHAAGDATNKLFRQFEAQLAALEPLRERVYTNVEFAVRDATPAELSAFINADPWLKKNAFFLEQRRKNAAMRLEKGEELLAADLAVDGIHAWGRLYDRLSGELRIKVMEKGEVVEKSASQIRFDSPERTVRQNNFYAFSKSWKSIADSCADSLNHICGVRLTTYKRLGLTDHLAMPLHRNRMQRGTLEAMWSAIARRKHVLLKYLDAKARLLGVKKLCWYDTQAPLPQASEVGHSAEISYDEGAERVIETFTKFSPHFGEFASHAFNNRWIESENRPGKRQGAFCTGFPGRKQTRVFMTFTNTYDNVSTLAHELGHAYHSWVLREQPPFLQDYPMNLAETASTFAEAVLGEQRLIESKSSGEKLAILDHMLSDAVAFLMNIHARFIFENNFHQERGTGELTAERLSELMLAAQKEAYLEGWMMKAGIPTSGFPSSISISAACRSTISLTRSATCFPPASSPWPKKAASRFPINIAGC